MIRSARNRTEDDHLGDEHALAAEIIRKAAERDGADQDARKACRGDEARLEGGKVEFALDQRHRDAAHEHDEPFEEFPKGRERPDAPLHARHGRGLQRGAIRPDGTSSIYSCTVLTLACAGRSAVVTSFIRLVPLRLPCGNDCRPCHRIRLTRVSRGKLATIGRVWHVKL